MIVAIAGQLNKRVNKAHFCLSKIVKMDLL